MPPTAYYFPPVPESQQTTHDLNTLADFADTLDALPLELTRGFSDLRELDAVLSCASRLPPLDAALARSRLLPIGADVLLSRGPFHPSQRA